MSTNYKVLVTGSTNGNFKELFAKTKQIHEKYGPFDVHLCTGNFFDVNTSEDSIQQLIDNKIEVPLMTYFIVGDQPIPALVQKHIEATDGEVCSNLYYLGKQGILTTSEGLKIAFISGKHDEEAKIATASYTKSDVQKLCLTRMPATLPAGVDFLLTHEWPQNVSEFSNLPPISIDEDKSSICISELAAALKPRYHFAASQSKFYEREPYKNILSGLAAPEERPADHATRFIGLGDVLNREKQRWFYAFNLVPMSKMSKEMLETIPENTTESPFLKLFSESNKRKDREEDDQGGSFFWGDEAKKARKSNVPREGYVCKICKQPGHFIQDCPQKSNNNEMSGNPSHGVYICHICNEPGHFIKQCPKRTAGNTQAKQPKLDDCWFCLSNPKLEKHLIVSIGTELYATLAKGPVVSSKDKDNGVPGGGHLLIVPVNHYSTFAKIPEESRTQVLTEFEKYKDSIRRLFEKYDQDMVIFEVSRESARGLVHAHVQVVPVPKSKSEQLEKIVTDEAALSNMNLVEQASRNPNVPYFKIELPNGKSLFHLLDFKERFNLQFGRLVIAKLLGFPEREDWKACMQTEDEEKADAEHFKAAFKPFDFSLNE